MSTGGWHLSHKMNGTTFGTTCQQVGGVGIRHGDSLREKELYESSSRKLSARSIADKGM